jgi:hypothetical protein
MAKNSITKVQQQLTTRLRLTDEAYVLPGAHVSSECSSLGRSDTPLDPVSHEGKNN